MLIITTNNLNGARKQVQKVQKERPLEKIAILSQDDEFNRKSLEIKGITMLILNESLNIKDYGKQRNSGLNEVLAKICKDKNIRIGIQIDEIILKETKEKARAIARLIQNIMLCKKAGTKLIFLSNNPKIDKKALQSLFLSLGASTNQALEAINPGF